MMYDIFYLQNELRSRMNMDYERYKDTTILDILLEKINSEEIFDFTQVNWKLFNQEIFKRGNLDHGFYVAILDNKLETVVSKLRSREIRIKFLLYIQKHVLSIFEGWAGIDTIKNECSRLISKEIKESENDEYHGVFCNMLRPNYAQYIQDPKIFKQKTPTTVWAEQHLKQKNTQNEIKLVLSNISINQCEEIERILIKLADDCADAANPCSSFIILDVAINFVSSNDMNEYSSAKVRERIDAVQKAVIDKTEANYSRRTPAYQVMTLVYVLWLSNPNKTKLDENRAQAIAKEIFNNPTCIGTKEMATQAIKAIKQTYESHQTTVDSANDKSLTEIIRENNKIKKQLLKLQQELEQKSTELVMAQKTESNTHKQITRINKELKAAKELIEKYIRSDQVSIEMLLQKADEIDNTAKLDAVKLYLHSLGLNQQRVSKLKGNMPKTTFNIGTIQQLNMGNGTQSTQALTE